MTQIAGQKIHTTAIVILVCFVVGTTISYLVFLVNAFQFGMDQLHDSSTQDLISYIHWYVWIYYISSLLTQLQWNLFFSDSVNFGYVDKIRISGIGVIMLVFIAIFSLLTVSLCVFRKKRVWFLLEPAGINPYKLVYRVVKFACQHKVPLNRSAFTYCEDELPSRLDLGKSKYGGPFTTKQVEDVKAFLGILKVLLSIGPAFFLQTASQAILPVFSRHSVIFIQDNNNSKHEVHIEGIARHIIFSNGLLSPMLVVICIPLYMYLIRPHILYHTL